MADSVIQAPSVSGKPFGPNMDAFLAKVLPSAKSGYVLAVNEYHGLSEYVDNLAKNWSNLSALGEHNVGTLGLERPLYMNVVFWAMQEKKLPVSPEREADYLRQIMQTDLEPKQGAVENAVRQAVLVTQVIRQGDEVIAFDSRTDNLTGSHLAIDAVRKDMIARKIDRNLLRNSPEALQAWANEAGLRIGLRSDDGNTPATNAKTVWGYIEIQNLLEKNPAYEERLNTMKAMSKQMAKKGITHDAQNATIFATNAAPSRNSITISGLAHNAGIKDESLSIHGTFAAHLQSRGLRLTSVIMTTSNELKEWIAHTSPGQPIYNYFIKNCAARAPMQLAVLDQDVVLDVSSRKNFEGFRGVIEMLLAEQSAKEVVSKLAKTGAMFTCDQSELPTTAQKATKERPRGVN